MAWQAYHVWFFSMLKTVPCSAVAGPLAGVWTFLPRLTVSSPPPDLLLLLWNIQVSTRRDGCPKARVRTSVWSEEARRAGASCQCWGYGVSNNHPFRATGWEMDRRDKTQGEEVPTRNVAVQARSGSADKESRGGIGADIRPWSMLKGRRP